MYNINGFFFISKESYGQFKNPSAENMVLDKKFVFLLNFKVLQTHWPTLFLSVEV